LRDIQPERVGVGEPAAHLLDAHGAVAVGAQAGVVRAHEPDHRQQQAEAVELEQGKAGVHGWSAAGA